MRSMASCSASGSTAVRTADGGTASAVTGRALTPSSRSSAPKAPARASARASAGQPRGSSSTGTRMRRGVSAGSASWRSALRSSCRAPRARPIAFRDHGVATHAATECACRSGSRIARARGTIGRCAAAHTVVVMSIITTPFGFRSTAAEVVAGIDLSGKRAIVTGAASGIGVETARALAGAGSRVTLAVRNTQAGSAAAADIAATTGRDDVAVAALELTDPASVAALAAAWEGPLDILVNNTGVMMTPEQRTPQGWELQFATNHLGHFALARALRRALAAAGSARIVLVSSAGHLYSPVVFDDLQFRFRPYDPLLAYAQSKTAAILFAVGATERWAADGITANALNPGATATNLQRHVGGKLVTPPERQKTPQQGAATTVLLASSPALEGIGGRYFSDCNEAPTVDHRNAEGTGVAAYALDPSNAQRLWDVSEGLVHRS